MVEVVGTRSGVVFAVLIWASPATAQLLGTYFDPVPTISGGQANDVSLEEANNLYKAPGMRVGSFVIRPDVTESFGYNSNVEGRSNGRGSAMTDTNTSLSATSDWSRNSSFFSAQAINRQYLGLPQQSFMNWFARLGGTLDVGSDVITLTYAHSNLVQQPGALNAVTTLEPVPFRIDTAQMSYAATNFGRFTFTPELDFTAYNFDSFTTGTTPISQAYLNNIALQGGLTTQYQFASGREAVLVVRGTHITYGTEALNTPKRSSNGVAVLGGLDYAASNFRYRALVGVQARQYQNTAYMSQVAPILEASVIWAPTGLTTLALLARRDIENAEDESIAGYVLTSARLSVSHELKRDVRLNGYAELQRADYQSTRIAVPVTINQAGSEQSFYNAGASVTWLLDRNIRARMTYKFSEHRGSGVSSDYLSNITLLSLEIGL